MKEGLLGAALISIWPARRQDSVSWEAGCVGSSPEGLSGGQTKSGASGSVWGEGLIAGEHVPDRFGELSGARGRALNIIQRQLGHANLGTTSIYLQGIYTEEIIATVHARRGPMMSASAGLRL